MSNDESGIPKSLNETPEKAPHKSFGAKTIAKIGVLAAIATLVMALKVPLFFAPSFYKLDFSEAIVLMGAFSMGPAAGALIEAIKVLLNFAIDGTITAGIGELSNFLIGCSFIVPAAIIYQRQKTKKRAMIGIFVGLILMVIFSALINYYVLIPVFANVLGMPVDTIVSMGTKINSAITNLNTLIVFAVVPFNILKGGASALIAMLLYKKLSGLLHI